MKLSVSRLMGRLIGWILILLIVVVVVPIGTVASIFSYCSNILFEILRNTSTIS